MRTGTQPATFTGSGGDQLAARLDLPDGEPQAFALFAHCFTCSKDLAAATRISRGLVERGFGVLRFDFTGLGSSEGEFANTNFSSNVDDLVLAAGWLRDHHQAPAVLVGHSLGGAAGPGDSRADPRGGGGGEHRRPVRPGTRHRALSGDGAHSSGDRR